MSEERVEERRQYGVSVHLHFHEEGDTVEEAFQRVFNAVKDAIHYTGCSEQGATILVSGDEDELTASLDAEWKNAILTKVCTEREVF